MLKNKLAVTALCGMLFLAACGDKGNNSPDVSHVNIAYTSYPLYQDFIAMDYQQAAQSLTKLQQQYPQFLDFYLDTLIGFGFHHHYTDTNTMLKDFFTMKDYKQLLDTVKLAFPNTKQYDEWLKKSFQYITYYDSTFEVPQHVYYFVSYLNGLAAVLQNEHNMGIGLDMFLGRQFFPYQQLGIPEYATIRNTPENIPVWAVRAIYQDRFPYQVEGKDLLYLLIQKGKEQYFIDKTTPYLPEEIRFGFTKEQLEWCEKNEAMVYNFFLQNQLLFETNLQKTMRYVSDGPSATGMPLESPGNVGAYIGFSIVKKYAENTGASMAELLKNTNAQEILKGANYKP